MRFGLDENIIERITRVFENNPKVDKALLFGSRAKGNYRTDSDIDIAIKGFDITLDDILKMSVAIEEKGITNKIDLVDYYSLKEKSMVEHIDRVGIELYSSWKEFKLDELAEIYNNKRVPLSSMQRAARIGIFPYYGASGIIDYIDDYLFEGKYVLISEDGENLNSRQTQIAFKASGKFWVNNHAHIIKGKEEHINNLLIYFFAGLDLTPYITGAVQPKLSKENLLLIPFRLPKSKDEQIAIASVLSSLDDKIDLLNRQNKTMEQLAETLFRQWFVEEAEESWNEIALSEIAEHLKENINPSKKPNKLYKHFSLPSFDEGREPVVEIGKEILSNKYKVYSNSILVSKLNPRTPRIWMLFGNINADECICSTEFQVVNAKNIIWFGFIYCFLMSKQVTQELASASGGTSGSHQRVNPQDIFNLTFLKPPEKIVKEFDSITKDYWQKIINNQTQIHTLTKLRNTLLPKLMSGQVRVK